MTDQTEPVQATAPTYRIHLDLFAEPRAFECSICRTAFRARVTPLRYPADDPEGGRWICRTCLAGGSARLAMICEALELIATAGGDSEEALTLAGGAVSAMRRLELKRRIEVAADSLYGVGGHAPPEVVRVGDKVLSDSADLIASARLVNGRPYLVLQDRGGFGLIDTDTDTARDVIRTISDLVDLADMAARFGPLPDVDDL